MPELPEVETIKNDLLPLVAGRRIINVTVDDPMVIQHLSMETFRNGLVGRTISAVERRGKYLIFKLDDNKALIVHLRMTGSMLLIGGKEQSTGILRDHRVRASFGLDDGSKLVFVDRRRLGVMWLVNDREEVVGKLGPEPLGSDFTSGFLSQVLSRHHAPVKAILLDQQLIAGIGNMYADEALFRAGIYPLTASNMLSEPEIKRLHRAIRHVLKAAIVNKGASVDTYYRPDGVKGTAHHGFKVAHRRGGRCTVCGTTIERIVVRNRGTFFCPRCQPNRN